ncbi:hypothetical protein Ocin01_20084 [Orchesella cincta]|uniref:Nicastrin n=1 Tax=Orchesella cincta TaxID=48709 RepID=A0A1D2M0W1_ORCCI|nr:hypothetical protein Ocin01_20084 [Orchesella cincta]
MIMRLLSFVIWIPALEILVVCIAYGYDPTSISVGVVNQELNASRCPEIIPIQGECDVDLLSCSFLSHIPFEKLELIPFERSKMKSAIHSGLVWGYVLFSPNFSSSMYERVITGVDADQSVLNSSTIIVKLDDTNKPISASINVALHDALEDFTSTLLSNCVLTPGKVTPHSKLFFWPIVFVGTRFMGGADKRHASRDPLWLVFAIGKSFWRISSQSFSFCFHKQFFAFSGFLFGSLCRDKVQIPILAVAAFIPI